MSVVFSCQSDEVSWESSGLKRSVFSHFVTRYLEKSAGSRYDEDGHVMLDELVSYVRKKTNDLVFDSNLSNKGQYPVLRGEGANWSLGELLVSSWMQFRGPNQGHGPGDPHIHWDATTNIKWKTPLRRTPGATSGHSRPIVVADLVFVTSGSVAPSGEDQPDQPYRHLLCFHRASGEELWR